MRKSKVDRRGKEPQKNSWKTGVCFHPLFAQSNCSVQNCSVVVRLCTNPKRKRGRIGIDAVMSVRPRLHFGLVGFPGAANNPKKIAGNVRLLVAAPRENM